MMPLLLMLLPKSQLREEKPLPLKESPKMLLPQESIQLCSLKHRLKPKPKLKLKLPLNQVPVLPPLPLPMHPLVLMLPLIQLLNILLSKSLMEVSQLMFLSKDLALNARLDKLLKFNIPVLLLPTVKCSIHPFQEDSQLHSPSET